MGNRISQFHVDKLGRYAEIFPGFAFKSERFTDDPADVALVKGENVQQGFIDWSESKYWPIVDADSFSKFELRVGDIVLAMDRPWVTAGLKWAHIKRHDPTALLVQRVSRLRAKNGLNQTYLRCVISSRYFSDYIQPIVTGVNVPHISGKQISDVKIPLPPPLIQQKIAAIPSAYDELIDNNQRRIALLEKMAEEIYREWFVRLRFPGYEKVKFVKGVPEGWKLVRLENAFKFTGGGTPTKDVTRYWDSGDVNWFTPSDITGADGIFLERSGEQCTEVGFNNSSAKMFPANSVMLTSRATIGAVGINLTPACTNQGFITCIPNARYPLPYLYHWIKLAKPHFELLSGGATFAELTKRTFKRIEIMTPPEPIVTEFARIESPLFEAIENHLRANRKLTETRDKLLPRLISGKLSVEDLAIQFPPSMKEPAHET